MTRTAILSTRSLMRFRRSASQMSFHWTHGTLGIPFGLNPFWCEDPTNVELASRKAGQGYGVIEARWGIARNGGNSWGPVLPSTCAISVISLWKIQAYPWPTYRVC